MTVLVLQVGNLGFDIKAPVFVLSFFLGIYKLDLLNAFCLDLMQMINFTEERGIDSMIAEMAMKEDASHLKRLP